MVCGGRDLKYHPVPPPATGRGSSLFVYSEKGPFKRCAWGNPWLSWLMFYYCWGLDRKFQINYNAKILRSSYQRWTWTSWDCFELLPSQQKGSCPIWWAWNDSPKTASHPPNPRRLCGFPASLVSVPETRIFYLHLPSVGENLLPMFFELVPISTAHTSSFPSMETIPGLYHTQPPNKRSHCQDTLISPHNEMWQCRWQEKREQFTHTLQKDAITETT